MSESRNNDTGEAKTKLGAIKEFVAKGIVDTVAKKQFHLSMGCAYSFMGITSLWVQDSNLREKDQKGSLSLHVLVLYRWVIVFGAVPVQQ